VQINRPIVLRALGELTIIIVGVLIAFQVESWRDAQGARRSEQVQLAALISDFEETQSRIDEVIRSQRGTLAAIDQVLLISSGQVDEPASDSMRVLFAKLFTFYRLEPVTGAYDALVSSGNLGLLRNAELRSELADFASAVGDGYEDASLADALHLELALRAAQVVDVLGAEAPDFLGRFSYSGSAPAVDFQPLLSDRQFTGTLTFVGITEGTHLAYFVDVRARVSRMIELLRSGRSDELRSR